MQPIIRTARVDELHEINAHYLKIGFLSSSDEKQIIAIAEVEGKCIGLGRLIPMGPSASELGGIYVKKSYRNKGIANELVRYLLACAKKDETIYCVPFAYLCHYYERLGFNLCDLHDSRIPEAVKANHHWSRENFVDPTLLMSYSS